MPATLITGMSATGKSSTILRLVALGYRAIDLDTDEWSHLVPDGSDYADLAADNPRDWRWREDKVRTLLTTELTTDEGSLFVAGTDTYQSRFYPLLNHIVLLTVPEQVALERLATRTTNDYGKDPIELDRELRLRAIVEPRLRMSACLEIDTSIHAPDEVAASVAAHQSTSGCPRSPESEVAPKLPGPGIISD